MSKTVEQKDVKEGLEFQLIEPIRYQKQGSAVDIPSLYLKAPSRKVTNKARALKQLFFRAMGSNPVTSSAPDKATIEQKGESNADDLPPAKDIIVMIMMSSVALEDFFEPLKAILTAGGAYIDHENILPEYCYNQLSSTDEELLLGEYLRNFLLSFWLKKKAA